MLAPAEGDGFGFSPSDDRPDEDTRRKKADLAAADEMETRPYVKQMVQHQWTKIWLRQQDIKQIEAGDFSCVNFAPLQPFLASPPVLRWSTVGFCCRALPRLRVQ